jgi:hypothetical protein
VIVAMAPQWADHLRLLAGEWETPAVRIGAVGGDTLNFAGAEPVALDALLDASRRALAVGVEAEMA